MKYLSLFSGIGGFELGIGDKGECVGYSEIDNYAISVYKKHFSEHKNYGDATEIDPRQLPDFDVLVGGFPCQAFSIAGKRQGFEDTRGTLFFDIARILSEKRPRHLVLENVKGLLSHDKGKTFQTILGVLSDLGYRVEWQLLNSKYFGVPQNRERVLIIGHFRKECKQQVLPIREGYQRNDVQEGETQSKGKWVRRPYISGAIDANYHKGAGATRQLIQVGNIDQRGHNSLWGRVYDTDGLSATINAKGGGLGAKTGLYALTETRTDEAKRIRRENMKQGKDYSPRRGKELKPRDDNLANTVTAGQSKEHLLSDGVRVRKLTPRECERLQAFPDDWTRYGERGEEISDTQRYKMCGNAVTTTVIHAVFDKLTNCYAD